MEEFSDLDDETGINIAQINNIDFSRSIVENIDFQKPEFNNSYNERHELNSLNYQLKNKHTNNNNFLNFHNHLENDSFLSYPKRYSNEYDKFIDENFSNNVSPYTNEIKKKDLFTHDENNTNVLRKNNLKDIPIMNRLIEITKNYNKINPKKDKIIFNNINENISELKIINEEKNLNSSQNAFTSNNFYLIVYRFLQSITKYCTNSKYF